MTALKWITTEAKKLRKQYPKRFSTWREYVAQASAIYASKHKGKSPVGKKRKVGAVKKVAKKSPAKSEYHKDTKSHNVNIRVMSGDLKNVMSVLEFYKKLATEINQRQNVLENVQSRKKELIEKNGLRWYNNWIKHAKKIITAQKKLLTQVKKQM